MTRAINADILRCCARMDTPSTKWALSKLAVLCSTSDIIHPYLRRGIDCRHGSTVEDREDRVEPELATHHEGISMVEGVPAYCAYQDKMCSEHGDTICMWMSELVDQD